MKDHRYLSDNDKKLGDVLVAFFVTAANPPKKAVIWAPDGTPYDVSGNNFGKGKTTIVIPGDCTHNDMLILYSTAQKFHCVNKTSGFTMICIKNATNFPNIGTVFKANQWPVACTIQVLQS
jgi:hypothetical protein